MKQNQTRSNKINLVFHRYIQVNQEQHISTKINQYRSTSTKINHYKPGLTKINQNHPNLPWITKINKDSLRPIIKTICVYTCYTWTFQNNYTFKRNPFCENNTITFCICQAVLLCWVAVKAAVPSLQYSGPTLQRVRTTVDLARIKKKKKSNKTKSDILSILDKQRTLYTEQRTMLCLI